MLIFMSQFENVLCKFSMIFLRLMSVAAISTVSSVYRGCLHCLLWSKWENKQCGALYILTHPLEDLYFGREGTSCFHFVVIARFTSEFLMCLLEAAKVVKDALSLVYAFMGWNWRLNSTSRVTNSYEIRTVLDTTCSHLFGCKFFSARFLV